MPVRHKYQRIKLRKAIPDDTRTDAKDKVAELITELQENGEWPIPLTEVAERANVSRGTVTNTLESYFVREQSEEPDTTNNQSNGQTVIRVPEGMDTVSYIRGYICGIKENEN